MGDVNLSAGDSKISVNGNMDIGGGGEGTYPAS